MATIATSLQMPPRRQTAEGAERRVGVELELSGLKLEPLAQVVAEHLQLQVETTGRYERCLKGDPAGDWIIELDFDYLKKLGREARPEDDLRSDLEEMAEQVLSWGAQQLVPLEVVGPPLPLARLGEVESLIAHLRAQGAQGTSGNLLYAFGLQFNPEVPATDVDTLRDYLRAFLCAYDWLYKRANINITRRLTRYVDPFPRSYVRKLMAADYRPGLAQFIDDYLRDNPTRNRALDLLPLFSHLDEQRVRQATNDPLIKARPTFHYRLPNCEIDRADWGLYLSWNDWIQVEYLAEDKARLADCCRAYEQHLEQALHLPGDWYKALEDKWLHTSP